MVARMAIGSVNYPHPVRVNGFECRNCTDVDLAKKRVDPRHPQSGPDNRDAVSDPTRSDADPVKIDAARKAAKAKGEQIAGYSPNGTRYTRADAAQVLSISA